MTSLRNSLKLRMTAIMLAVGVVLLALVGTSRLVEAVPRWPIRVEYSVTALEYADIESPQTRAQYIFAGGSWQSWTNRPVGGDDTICQVYTAEGVLYAGLGGCAVLSERLEGESDSGMSPNAFLNGRTVQQYEELGYSLSAHGRADDLAARLDIPVEDLVELSASETTTCAKLGYLECGPVAEKVAVHRETVVVHQPTGLPVLNESLLGDAVLSRYQVNDIAFVVDYNPPTYPIGRLTN